MSNPQARFSLLVSVLQDLSHKFYVFAVYGKKKNAIGISMLQYLEWPLSKKMMYIHVATSDTIFLSPPPHGPAEELPGLPSSGGLGRCAELQELPDRLQPTDSGGGHGCRQGQ